MDKYTMIFTKTGIAPGSNVEVFQIGKFQEARIVYSEVELVSGGTTSDKVSLAVNDQLGSGLGMILASVTGDTAYQFLLGYISNLKDPVILEVGAMYQFLLGYISNNK